MLVERGGQRQRLGFRNPEHEQARLRRPGVVVGLARSGEAAIAGLEEGRLQSLHAGGVFLIVEPA